MKKSATNQNRSVPPALFTDTLRNYASNHQPKARGIRFNSPLPGLPEQQDLTPSPQIQKMPTPTSSLSTLSSISDNKQPLKFMSLFRPRSIIFYPNSAAQDKSNSSNSANPEVHIKMLKRIHKRVKRRRKWRKLRQILIFFFNLVLPFCFLVMSIASLVLWHYTKIEWLLTAGSLGIIGTFGWLVQACFWKRAMPNNFNPSEVPFAVDQTHVAVPEENQLPIGINLNPRVSLKSINYSVPSQRGSKDTNILNDVEGERRSSVVPQQFMLGVDPLQVRRLSMALNKASQELSAARKLQQQEGAAPMLSLARRLTMAGSTFGDVRLGEENNWLGGRVARGVRSNLAWNRTGAGRFYAENYG
ncbi:hypothetical protein Ciccas_010747 [Cichlidogyrus casuarinus]|uniref:Uncharacterized protein n=1 Tax=Cichlidogyrus casuarinus TaxID=1844966 RepID=A0ABD2PT74_9PLAT